MITHIVVWKFKPESELGAPKAETAAALKEKLERLPALIPEIRSLSAGADALHTQASYDFGLIVTVDSRADLETYRVHPDHTPVVEYVASIASARIVVDFES